MKERKLWDLSSNDKGKTVNRLLMWLVIDYNVTNTEIGTVLTLWN